MQVCHRAAAPNLLWAVYQPDRELFHLLVLPKSASGLAADAWNGQCVGQNTEVEAEGALGFALHAVPALLSFRLVTVMMFAGAPHVVAAPAPMESHKQRAAGTGKMRFGEDAL